MASPAQKPKGGNDGGTGSRPAGGDSPLTPPPEVAGTERNNQDPETPYFNAHSKIVIASPPAKKGESPILSPTATAPETQPAPSDSPPVTAAAGASLAPLQDRSTAAIEAHHLSHSSQSSPADSGAADSGAPTGTSERLSYPSLSSAANKSAINDTTTTRHGVPVQKNSENITGFDKLMTYQNIIDQGGLPEPEFHGIIVISGCQDAGKSYLLNSIAVPCGSTRLVPVNAGPCTNSFIRVKLVRSHGDQDPIVNVTLPTLPSSGNQCKFPSQSIGAAHDIMKAFMEENEAELSRRIYTIDVELTSPHVPSTTIVDTRGLLLSRPESFDNISHFLKSEDEPISCLFCMGPPPIGNFLHEAERVTFERLKKIFHEANSEFTPNNVIVVMSKIDKLVDLNYEQYVDPAIREGGRLWFLQKVLADATIFNGFPFVGILNPDTRLRSSDHGDLYSREQEFLRDNNNGTSIDDSISIGRAMLAKHYDIMHRRHTQSSVNEEIDKKKEAVKQVRRQLEGIGDDPQSQQFQDEAKGLYQRAIASGFGGMQGDCIEIVKKESWKDSHCLSTGEIEEKAKEIAWITEQAVAKMLNQVIGSCHGSDKMRLERFNSDVSAPIDKEARFLCKGCADSFIPAVKKAVSFSTQLVEHRVLSSERALESLQDVLAKRVYDNILEPVNTLLQASSKTLSSIKLKEDDETSALRKELNKELNALLGEIDLLEQLLPLNEDTPEKDGDENRAGDDNGDTNHEDKDNHPGDGGAGADSKKGDNDDAEGTAPDYFSSGDGEDGGRVCGGKGTSRDKKHQGRNDHGTSAYLLSSRHTAYTAVTEAAKAFRHVVSAGSSSSSESEDFSNIHKRRRRKSGQTSGASDSHHAKRSKRGLAKSPFATDMMITTHFDEVGWCKGTIDGKSNKPGKDWRVIYEDGEHWDFTVAELSNKRIHKIVGVQI